MDFLTVALIVIIMIVEVSIIILSHESKKFERKTGISLRNVIAGDLKSALNSKILFSKEYRIRGKPDIIAIDPETRKYIPVEYKSSVRETPLESHVIQLVAYCLLLEEEYKTPPPYGVLIYENGRGFRILYTPEQKERLLRIVEEIREYKVSRKIPQVYTADKNKCLKCGYSYICEIGRSFLEEKIH